MPESKRSVSAGVAAGKPTGGRALLGVAMAIVGALAPVITACGAILAAVSEPPGMRRQK